MAAASKFDPWQRKGQVPGTLGSRYFDPVCVGDVVWVLQVISPEDALVLTRFGVSGVTRLGSKETVLDGPSTDGLANISLAENKTQLEFEDTTGTLAGYCPCACGGQVVIKAESHRGFRTGWQLTRESADTLEALWSARWRHEYT